MQVQLTLRVSLELHDLMKQGMAQHKHRSMNEFVRACIRAYLDETGDIIGSRRHFNKRMGERIDRLITLFRVEPKWLNAEYGQQMAHHWYS